MTIAHSAASTRAAVLRLAGVFLAAAAVVQMLLWFLPVGNSVLGQVGVLLASGLLAALAAVIARGDGSAGSGLVDHRGAAAFLSFAVLVVIRPLVGWIVPSDDSLTTALAVSSAVVLVLGVLTVLAAGAGLWFLRGAVPTRVVVVAAIALAINAAADWVTSVPFLVTADPSQEVLIALWTIGSMAGTFSLLAAGVVWILAARTLARAPARARPTR